MRQYTQLSKPKKRWSGRQSKKLGSGRNPISDLYRAALGHGGLELSCPAEVYSEGLVQCLSINKHIILVSIEGTLEYSFTHLPQQRPHARGHVDKQGQPL